MTQGSTQGSTGKASGGGGVAGGAGTTTAIARWRKIARRLAMGLVAILVLLIVAFFLFPVWISNEQGRAYILDRLNHRLNEGPSGVGAAGGGSVKVMVEDWKLGWFRGTDLKNVRITLADGSTFLTCSEVKSGLTLWDIFWGNYDLHDTTIGDLHLTLTRTADGHGSWEALAPAASDWLRTVRGSLRTGGGDILAVSARSGESVHYREVTSTLTIASPDAPFHFQLSAVATSEMPGGGGTISLPGDLSINATLPSVRTLLERQVSPWSVLGDVEFATTNVPAGLACDALGLDHDWAEALGQSLELLRFSNHAAAPQESSRPMLLVKGSGPTTAGASDTLIDLRLLLRAPDGPDDIGEGLLALPSTGGIGATNEEDFHAEASLRLSSSVAELLRRLNPVLGDARPMAAGGGGNVRVSLSALKVPLARPSESEADGRVTFPEITFTSGGSASVSLVDQFQAIVEGPARPARQLAGSAELLRARLSNGFIRYENFLVTLDRTRINFSGNVGLNDAVDLRALIPEIGGAALGTGSMQVVVAGTVDKPVVRRAQ